MTFDDGTVIICDVENRAEPGKIPEKKLKYRETHCFSEQSLGIQRYYEAIKANQLIERVIAIYQAPVSVNQMAVFEDGSQYLIRMVQPGVDENGIKIAKLSLERNGEQYATDF